MSDLRFNSFVDAVLVEQEDRDRFYKETERNKWYREVLVAMLDKYIADLAKEEEATFGTTEQKSTVAQRIAARKLQSALKIGDK